jgi:hypothetical protein
MELGEFIEKTRPSWLDRAVLVCKHIQFFGGRTAIQYHLVRVESEFYLLGKGMGAESGQDRRISISAEEALSLTERFSPDSLQHDYVFGYASQMAFETAAYGKASPEATEDERLYQMAIRNQTTRNISPPLKVLRPDGRTVEVSEVVLKDGEWQNEQWGVGHVTVTCTSAPYPDEHGALTWDVMDLTSAILVFDGWLYIVLLPKNAPAER